MNSDHGITVASASRVASDAENNQIHDRGFVQLNRGAIDHLAARHGLGFDEVGILRHLVEHVDRRTRTLATTITDMAADLRLSRRRVSAALAALEAAGVLVIDMPGHGWLGTVEIDAEVWELCVRAGARRGRANQRVEAPAHTSFSRERDIDTTPSPQPTAKDQVDNAQGGGGGERDSPLSSAASIVERLPEHLAAELGRNARRRLDRHLAARARDLGVTPADLAEQVAERPLDGVRSVAAVLHRRLDEATADPAPPRIPDWCDVVAELEEGPLPFSFRPDFAALRTEVFGANRGFD